MSDKDDGYLIDYISKKRVRATPEEKEAVQPFSRMLVEDYGYPEANIRTRPQYRVKARPSDERKEYPVDIAVFSSPEHVESALELVVECKKKTRKDGQSQLEDYLRLSQARMGVWYNGLEFLFLLKTEKGGKVYFEEIPNIPRYGERIEDVGQYKRRHLRPTHNLKEIFKGIRYYLAANAVGTTRDEELARQLINLIFCKLYDEKFTKPDDKVQFRAGIEEDPTEIARRIRGRFEETKKTYADVLEVSDRIQLDDRSVAFVAGQLQRYCLLDVQRDVIADAFEVFIGRALKGSQGQFFTPRNVVRTVVEILNPTKDDRIIDPACGSGGFITECLKQLHRKIEEHGKSFGWPEAEIGAEKISKANNNLRGIEKDTFLSKVAKAYMVILGDGRSGIFCEDSLESPQNWAEKSRSAVQLGSFDIVMTNPPFGAKIPVSGQTKLAQYPLGHRWKKKQDGTWEKGAVKASESPQVLFIDRCLDLLKDGGRLGIVLPDGTLSNPTEGWIRQSILERAEIIGLIDLPMSTFLPHTPTKTHLLFLRKKKEPASDYPIFMSYAKNCGHDKRGRETSADEIREIPQHLKELERGTTGTRLGFRMQLASLFNGILLPKYYNPDLKKQIATYALSPGYDVRSVASLVEEGTIKINRGNEVGSEYYGTGDIPFIRTSEVANWEIVADATHCVSGEVYNKFKKTQDVKEEDILVVNDGTYLMGRTAMVTDLDLEIVFQSHFRKITVVDRDRLSPYLLLALLGLEVVQKQIESKSFRQGTISTLGNRLLEVSVPMPRKKSEVAAIVEMTKSVIKAKRDARALVQDYVFAGKKEALMGIRNKARLGNL